MNQSAFVARRPRSQRELCAERLNAALAYEARIRAARLLASKAGDWDKVDYLGECIDDNRDELDAARAAMREYC